MRCHSLFCGKTKKNISSDVFLLLFFYPACTVCFQSVSFYMYVFACIGSGRNMPSSMSKVCDLS